MAKITERSRSFLFPSAPKPKEEMTARTKDEKWTISQEREFMEDLVYKRLTLFLAITAALIAGAIDLQDSPRLSIMLLVFGTILCWILQQTVHRAQLKLDIILDILFKDGSHPVGYINVILNDDGRVKWVGYLVPSGICILLTLLTAAEIISYFT